MEKLLHNVMREAVDHQDVMGVSMLVKKDGQEIFYGDEGMADREKGTPMSRDTIFRMYSQTKPVTALAAMILLERGKLDLFSQVGEILPEFAVQKFWKDGALAEPERPMQVFDLLRMTSGLVYPEKTSEAERYTEAVFDELDRRLFTENAMTTRELAKKLAEGPLLYSPGTSWSYGTSADVLGAVIQEVTGGKLSEFMEKEIFVPLGMKDTAFWVPEEKRDRLAAAYETVVGEDGSRRMERYTGNNLGIRNDMAAPPAYEAGGAGLASTLDDYMKFAEMLLSEGKIPGTGSGSTAGEKESPRILQPRTVAYMTGGELQPRQQAVYEKRFGYDGYSYGNLMRTGQNPRKGGLLIRQGEYGWDGWLGTYFMNFPMEKMTILIGMQKKDAGTWGLTRKLRNVVLSHME